MKIFLAHAYEDKDVAERVYLKLHDKHQVFFDEVSLPAGSDYDSRIQKAIAESKKAKGKSEGAA